MERFSEGPPKGIKLNAHLVLIHDQADLPVTAGSDLAEVLATFHCVRPKQNLDILEAMLAMQALSTEHSLLDVLPAFTLHAAEALFEDKHLGSIEVGKNPGINLLVDTEPGTIRLTGKTALRVLV
jgi:hypothetical protein